MMQGWRIAALKNGFRDATAYRVEFLIEIASSALIPATMQWILWYSLFQLGDNTKIAGMSYQDMLNYTWVSMLFSQVRGGDHDFEIQEMIRTGQLSNYLLRPIGVIQFVYIRGLAPRLLIAGTCLTLGIIFSNSLATSPFRLLGSMFLALIGNVIHYQISAALSATAFFWEEAYSLLMAKNMLIGIISGETIPLTLFPDSLEWIWKSTPFYLCVFGPAQYALGHWSHSYFCSQLGIACLWLLFGWLAVCVSWRIGIRRYSSLGG